MNKLLVFCARPFYDQIVGDGILQEALSLKTWDTLIDQANAHGLTPLLHYHLSKYALEAMPESFKVRLQAQFLIHSQRNIIYMTVLQEILRHYRENGIDVLVLKGGALCHLIYPYPALRPMRDIDLLVKPNDATHAQLLLTELGFSAPIPGLNKFIVDHHLPPTKKVQDGMTIAVEIHHQALSRLGPRIMNGENRMEWEHLKKPFLFFTVGEETALTLGYEDMLRHLCCHLGAHPSLRLIYIADIIGFAEHYADKIDWYFVQKNHPFVISTLSNLGWLAPLSDNLKDRLRIKGGKAPQGIGVDYQGWPYSALGDVWNRPKALLQLIRETCSPSEWWLRLKYGIPDSHSVTLCKFVNHPLHLLKLAAWGWLVKLESTINMLVE